MFFLFGRTGGRFDGLLSLVSALGRQLEGGQIIVIGGIVEQALAELGVAPAFPVAFLTGFFSFQGLDETRCRRGGHAES